MQIVRSLKKHFVKVSLAMLLLAMVGIASLTPTHAAINKQVNFQGRLTDPSGNIVADGTYNMEFKLYSVSSGGTALWTETRTGGNKVTVSRGLFSIQLGEVQSLASFNFNQDPLYLGVNIGGTGTPGWDGEMTPRHRLGASPQAIYSADSDQLDGQDSTYFTNASNISSGTLADGRLSSNVALKNINNNFSTGQSIGGDLTVNTNTLKVDSANGRVGIGTATPGVLFDVYGNAADTGAQVLSGNATKYSYFSLGRSSADFQLAVAAATNQFLTGTAAGDSVIRAGLGGTQVIHIGMGSQILATFNASGLNVGIGNISGTFSGSGASITSLSASNISSGTLANARLSTNVALLNRASQVFTGTAQTFRNSSNGVNAFQVQNSSQFQIFNVDTSTTANLLASNPGFEVNTTGWAAKGTLSPALSRVTTNSYSGVASASVSPNAANSGIQFAVSQAVSTQYTFSAYVRASGSNFSTLQVGHQNVSGTDATDCTTNFTPVTTGWTRVSCTFTTAASVTTPNVYIKQTDATARTWYVDAAQLVTGAQAAAYNPGGTLQLRGVVNSPVTFQNKEDSTTGLSVTNAAGANQFSVDTLNGQLNIGADTNLYRSSADTLKTDDALVVTGNLTGSGSTNNLQGTNASTYLTSIYNQSTNSAAKGLSIRVDQNSATNVALNVQSGASTNILQATADGSVTVGSSSTGTLKLLNNAGTNTSGIQFGSSSDTNLYRSTGSTLKTDGKLEVGNTSATSSQLYVRGGSGGTNMLTLDRGTSAFSMALAGGGLSISDDTNSKTVANLYGSGGVNQFFVGQANSVTAQTNSALISAPTHQAAAGTDVAGQNLSIQGGLGTGAGTSGSIIFKTAAVGSSGTTAATSTNRMGIDGPTGNLNLYTASGKTAINLSDTTTTTGITIGGDTNLYRSAANMLTTDDDFQANSAFIGDVGFGSSFAGFKNKNVAAAADYALLQDNNGGTFLNYKAGQELFFRWGNNTIAKFDSGYNFVFDYQNQNKKIYFGSANDTNLYRSAADTLKTDDHFMVGGDAWIQGGTVSIDSGSGLINLDNTNGNTIGADGAGVSIQSAGAVEVDNLVNATGYEVNGTSGISATCSGGQVLTNQVTSGGIVIGGTCAATGATATLQSAYNATSGNTITTTNARDFSITLADTATDSNFITNIATGSTGTFKVQSNGTDRLSIGSAGQLALGAQGSTGGLLIGGDTNLYRSAANTLSTDDDFKAPAVVSSGNVHAYDGTSAWTVMGAQGPSGESGVRFGSSLDTNLYRSAADTLKTDDALSVGNYITSGSWQVANYNTTNNVVVGWKSGAASAISFGGTTANSYDTNIYRSAANALKTDGKLQIGTNAYASGINGDLSVARDGGSSTTGFAYFGSAGNYFGYDGSNFVTSTHFASKGNVSAGANSGAGAFIDADGFGNTGTNLTLCRGYFNEIGNCSSSETFKHDITPLGEAGDAETLRKMMGTEIYNYKTNGDGVQHVGIIAERVPKELTPTTSDGLPQPDFLNISAYVWSGTKALARDHDELKREVQQLKQTVDTLNGSKADASTVLSKNAAEVKQLKVSEKLVTGTIIVEGDLVLDDNRKGANVEVKKGQKKLEVKFGRAQRDESYTIQMTPSWITAYGVTTKTKDGFTVEFDKKAPKDAKLDWTSIR